MKWRLGAEPFGWEEGLITNRGEWAELAARLFLRLYLPSDVIHSSVGQYGPDIILGNHTIVEALRSVKLEPSLYMFLQDGRWALVSNDETLELPGVPHINQSSIEVKLRKRPSGWVNGKRSVGKAYCYKPKFLVYRDVTDGSEAGDLWAAILEHIQQGKVLVVDVKIGHKTQLKNVGVSGHDRESRK